MSRSKTIGRTAVLGFTITAVFVTYQLITDVQSPISRNPLLMVAFVVLCPPSLLSVPVIDAEVGTSAFYFVWTVIGVLNAALYGGVRALLLRWPRKVQ